MVIPRQPVDGDAVFLVYINKWAWIYGCHRVLLLDRDSILLADQNSQRFASLGCETHSIGAVAHFSTGSVENKIKLARYSIDRLRAESSAK